MYKADSKIAEEFIDHQEILDTLEYAHNNTRYCAKKPTQIKNTRTRVQNGKE